MPTEKHPCSPSPCGPNSRCLEYNDQAVCTCLPSYIGNPPSCRPECISSSDCPLNEACVNFKCQDPCPGTCGIQAQCHVHYHSAICTCAPPLTGDPFSRCYYPIGTHYHTYIVGLDLKFSACQAKIIKRCRLELT